jgi:hypothetical protein
MTKTIELTDLTISYINIDYRNQNVQVGYYLVDANEKIWEKGQATFWVNMPQNPLDNYFQLPATYFPTLINLLNDADISLSAHYLV